MITSRWRCLGLASLLAAILTFALAATAATLSFTARSRTHADTDTNTWNSVEKPIQWDPRRTAIVICDMWDRHWCAGATRRVAGMAPRMNEVIRKGRSQGVFIIHCPSDTMKFYEGSAGRKLAQAAPAVTPRTPLQNWCALDKAHEPPLPIDDSDGGCDDWPTCRNYTAWHSENPILQIETGDAITDSAEAYYLMRQRGIENVIVMGVHLNMCVLGRPFAIRQLIQQGMNVVLMRDMTDTMYNSRRSPYVLHVAGTALMIAHVEKYWCPTISSVAFLGGNEFRFAEDRPARVVMLIGEDEYKTWETLPAFARDELSWRGLEVKVLQEDASRKGQFPGLIEALREADVLVLSTKRRALPKDQLDAVRAHLTAGRSLVGLRTASHAFAPREQTGPEVDTWKTFDPEVLGGHYDDHHPPGPRTTVRVADGAGSDPILTGVNVTSLVGHGSLYRVSPLRPSTHPLLLGSIPHQPPEPVAWTHVFGPAKARIFYTSLGHPDDFTNAPFRRLFLNAILWAAGQVIPPASAGASGPPGSAGVAAPSGTASRFAREWQSLAVPGAWEDLAHLDYDGIAWYRCQIKIPEDWRGQDITLAIEKVDNAHEAYFNGTRIGGAGRFPPDYQNGVEVASRYVVPSEAVQPGTWNQLAVRVYDHEGRGGFKGDAPQLGTSKQHLDLNGPWQFRIGDDPSWAKPEPDPHPAVAAFASLQDGPVPRGSNGHKMADRGQPLTPIDAARTFMVPDDLEFEQVLAEPLVRQPVFLNFDERCRLWVVQYIQYPAPAGLNVISRDAWWRAVYDKVPEPPPRGVRGLDKITIHEDTDGDGRFDKHTTFVDGLNIATAVARGRGGVWVLNPPYLLFYPDANNDDVPDGPPAVHLAGFGLEDTHSVVNSLRWGPDGWLYGAQGSTVTANVRVLAGGAASNVVHYSQGQNIWRYHPETHRYEVFSEGGGNAFGVELDAQGRIFSGHNGGDTRGFHYMQGAYLLKGFEKHGELANPYAFGYFPSMSGTRGERFTHNFVIYHGGALPPVYAGNLFGVEPLQGRIVRSSMTREGSTFRTRDLDRVVTSTDTWFRPVDIKVGPDGAIYVCDWYDRQVTHTRNQEGNIDTSNGRIYRLKAKGAAPARMPNLGALSGLELVGMLRHTNEWFRQTAQRLLADRHDAALIPVLINLIPEARGQPALEALWALHGSGGWAEPLARSLLGHPEAQVRLWTARLLGDDGIAHADTAASLVRLCATEPDVEVRAQLACTARRLPAATALAMVAGLARHRDDVEESRIPLLCWWAIESHCGTNADEVLKLFEDSPFWTLPLVERHLLERTMRRFAATGTRRDLQYCARLLQLSPAREQSQRLMKGFEQAYAGRSLAGLPDEFIKAMTRHDVGSPAFRLRQGTPESVDQALAVIGDPRADKSQQLQFIQILGEVRQPRAVPILTRLLRGTTDSELGRSLLNALSAYDDPEIGRVVAALYPTFTADARVSAQALLASRTDWTLRLVEAVEAGRVRAADVPIDVVRRMGLHKQPDLSARLARLWPRPASPTTEAMQRQIQHLAQIVRGGQGDPYHGRELFTTTCASCHRLFAHGGQVGPDLTSYQRGDLEAMLLNIVNPSAQIREGYEGYVIETKDERTLNGFLVERDDRVVVLRGVDGQNVALDRKEIAEMKAASLSLMPEGLLDPLNEQQVRDLFAYLRCTQPLTR